MSCLIREALVTAALAAALSAALGAAAPQQHEHPGEHPAGGAHRHPAAAKMKNPVAADAASVDAGRQVYEKNCASCHGARGTGDGRMGEELTPRPSNLTDGEWKHGATDGEIFTVIRDGAKNTGMRPYARKLTARQIWDVVNYLRSIGPH